MFTVESSPFGKEVKRYKRDQTIKAFCNIELEGDRKKLPIQKGGAEKKLNKHFLNFLGGIKDLNQLTWVCT